jgi:selenocysteine lyase/cysteine desulfurase
MLSKLDHSSQLSLKYVEEARRVVLEFFGGLPTLNSGNDSDEYTVIFTPNASGALKLVGEAYQFSKGMPIINLLRYMQTSILSV